MANEPEKPRPVKITRPGHRKDNSGDVRINRDAAQRIIARYLRDEQRMAPGDANALATRIIAALVAAAPSPPRIGLRNARIPDIAPHGERTEIAHRCREIFESEELLDTLVAQRVWEVIYSYGIAVPDDVVS